MSTLKTDQIKAISILNQQDKDDYAEVSDLFEELDLFTTDFLALHHLVTTQKALEDFADEIENQHIISAFEIDFNRIKFSAEQALIIKNQSLIASDYQTYYNLVYREADVRYEDVRPLYVSELIDLIKAN